MSGLFKPPHPSNEPVRAYAPGTAERLSLQEELRRQEGLTVEAPCVIGGEDVFTGDTFERRAPQRQDLHVATAHAAGGTEVKAAI